jgi:serine protease Do
MFKTRHHRILWIVLFSLFLSGQAAPESTAKLWKEPDVSAAPPALGLPSFSGIVKKLEPSVVSFYVTTEVDVSSMDPMFKFFEEHFGGGGMPESFKQQGVGSGVIINEDGTILTNDHVVDSMTSIKAVLDNDETYDVRVVGADEATDLALVKIDAPYKLPSAPLGDSDKIEIGDWVVAIGSPFGLESTVTAGIVSAKERHQIGPTTQFHYQDMLQTDAPINPGNSGGPLVDLAGSVIGISTAVSASGQGIGFAIPINMAKDILPHLLKEGAMPRSWLGVTVQGMDDLLAKSLGMKDTRGALVADIDKGSPADKAGIEVGDVVIELDGKKVTSPDKLAWYASTAGSGKKVKLKVMRSGSLKEFEVKLASMPEAYSGGNARQKDRLKKAAKKAPPAGPGIKVEGIDPAEASKLGLQTKDGKTVGVVVTSIDPSSPFDDAGLRPGDIILDVGGQKCHGPADFYKKVKEAKPGDILRLYVMSNSKKGFTAVKKK